MQYITPTWPAPNNVFAYTTTRVGGHSQASYASFNLANDIGEDKQLVQQNRSLLTEILQLPSEPFWLKQVHSNKVIAIEDIKQDQVLAYDASFTRAANTVCVITTADCLPLLICNRAGTTVAAIHAGWRGLVNGVIENTINTIDEDPSQLMAWMGPAIGPTVFEVGDDVVNSFLAVNEVDITAFQAKKGETHKWLANIYTLAKLRLNALGVNQVYGGDHCTFSDVKNFYSYRRDHGITGRMATLIWFKA